MRAHNYLRTWEYHVKVPTHCSASGSGGGSGSDIMGTLYCNVSAHTGAKIAGDNAAVKYRCGKLLHATILPLPRNDIGILYTYNIVDINILYHKLLYDICYF